MKCQPHFIWKMIKYFKILSAAVVIGRLSKIFQVMFSLLQHSDMELTELKMRNFFFFTKRMNIFLISPQKHMLWVLIRSIMLRRLSWVPTTYCHEYPQHMFSWRNKKNIYSNTPHIYALERKYIFILAWKAKCHVLVLILLHTNSE